MDFKSKYIDYKNKYLVLKNRLNKNKKNMSGGFFPFRSIPLDHDSMLKIMNDYDLTDKERANYYEFFVKNKFSISKSDIKMKGCYNLNIIREKDYQIRCLKIDNNQQYQEFIDFVTDPNKLNKNKQN